MMEMSDPRLRSLLRQAERVAASGKRAAAEALYREIVEEAPQAEAAWLGLAGVLADGAEKTAVYERILQINPHNETAQAALNQKPAQPDTPAADWVKEALNKPETETAVPASVPEPQPVITAVPEPAADEFNLVCYRHSNRETALRCYTCGKPICTECAVKTPVGYSCPDCIRDLRKSYYTAKPLDYIITFLVALPVATMAAFLVSFVGFFVIFLAPMVGTFIGRVSFWAVRRRRGRYLPYLVGTTVVLGTVIAWFFGAGSFIWLAVYAFLAAGAAYYFVKV
jgi:hypothetical protein